MTISFDKDGLIPAVVQDEATNQVLMLGFMNRESLDRTLASGHVTFWSRSRQELWEKGATSGNYLNMVNVAYNCEGELPAGQRLGLRVPHATPAT